MILLSLLELLFSLLMLGIIALFILSLCWAWSWAQQSLGPATRAAELVSAAAVEWGAWISLGFAHLRRPSHFYEAPPLKLGEATPQQIPVIFIPSLHTSSSIFNFLLWRLRQNFWNSLWVFDWKAFLHDRDFLEDQLRCFIDEVIQRTEARRFRIVSFGSSLPIVSGVLDRSDLRAYCDRWVAVSSAVQLSPFFKFLNSERLKAAYRQDLESDKKPDLLIYGETDFFCYPTEVFGPARKLPLPNVGHFGAVLHSTTTQAVMKELSS